MATDRPVRCVFVSGHEFGMSALEGLLSAAEELGGGLEVPLALTLPQRHAAGTVGFLDQVPASDLIGEARPAVDARLVAEAEAIAATDPDFLLVIGWSWLIPDAVLDITARVRGQSERHGPAHGVLGMHPSLLPEGRGRAPIPWTIVKGLTRSALSVFRLERQADAGGIVMQLPIDVAPRETSSFLFHRVRALHAIAGYRVGHLMAQRSVPAVPQDESRVTEWKQRRPADSELDFSVPATTVDALVRAQTAPYPPGFVACRSGRLLVHRSTPLEGGDAEPGMLVELTEAGPVVACSPGSLRLDDITWEGPAPPWQIGVALTDH